MKVVSLTERPDLVDLVAGWGFGEWGHLRPGDTLEQRAARVRTGMNADRVPAVFVALADDGRPLGSAALVFDDLEGDPRNPWLASVFVPPEHRRRGVASVLVAAVEDAARRFGYSRLFLFTASAPELYARLGWRSLERRHYRGEHVQVMDKPL
ncbi:MAG: GNAT family N-acetyltransferase [Enhydrobacter sp.]|nr:MAG: GNAT family N-acetyltransferase [Enhydrobacter sp.]